MLPHASHDLPDQPVLLLQILRRAGVKLTQPDFAGHPHLGQTVPVSVIGQARQHFFMFIHFLVRFAHITFSYFYDKIPFSACCGRASADFLDRQR